MPQANERFHKNPQEHMNPEDKCSKYSDTPHIEGFMCPTSRFQCKQLRQIWAFQQVML